MQYLAIASVLACSGIAALYLLRHGTPTARARRALRARLAVRRLTCPLCRGRLPAWGGRFEDHPPGPAPVSWGRGGPPVGYLKLNCGRCGRAVWFWAWQDGSVGVDLGWLWEACKEGAG